MTREALLYHRDGPDGTLVCDLCHHRCRIAEGGCGICRARKNEGGRLLTLVYGRCLYHRPTPIEQKPLLHFLPGTQTMSFCTAGCNFKCPFCQNFQESQCLGESGADLPPGDDIEPRHIVDDALQDGCLSVSATWTEPTVFLEYVLDIARLARAEGLAVCLVSNGHMSLEAVDVLARWLDAINVDLKSFNPRLYKETLGGRLEGVLETLESLHRHGVWLEVSTTFVPGMNDSEEEMAGIAGFIADLSPDIPWIPNCFHPAYKMMETPRTPVTTIERAAEIGHEHGLRYVYHFDGGGRPDTLCSSCGKLLIERPKRPMTANHLTPDGDCPSCGTHCAGIWQSPHTGADAPV